MENQKIGGVIALKPFN